jgi:dTDP-4-amino-4,6-dideoxygalactose transaminase
MSDPLLPALLGGSPVRPEGPPVWPRADPDVLAAINSAIASGMWGQYHGENVRALEAELAAFHDCGQALTCASGTLAVEAALRTLRVGPGDEVVMAAYDYEANFLTVHSIGAKPILIDVAPNNWNLDPAGLAAAITPQTRAILCSHLHGGLVPMQEVVTLARELRIGVVEDAAQAPGAIVQGKRAGTWGDIGVLSFGGSKLLTSGRGGALLFSDAQLYQRARLWLHRGLQQWAPLSELQAASLRPQLRHLPQATHARCERVRQLIGAGSALASVPGLAPFLNTTADSIPAFYKVGFQFEPRRLGLSREVFVAALRAEGIALDVGFKALHLGRSPSRFRASGPLTHAAAAHEKCVILHHPVLSGTTDDIEQVGTAVVKIQRAVQAGHWPSRAVEND